MKYIFTLFFSLCMFLLLDAQTIALNPDNGDPGSAFTVTITGTATAFSVASTTTARISNGIESYDVNGSATSATRFSGTLDLPPDATSGLYNATLWQQGTAGTFWSCTDCFTINAACVLNGTTSVTPVACAGESNGAIDLEVVGAQGGETYLWSSGQTTQDISGVPAGAYTVTITEGSCSVEVTAMVSEPDLLMLSTAATQETTAGAADGSIQLTVSGGSLPYSYIWSHGATTQNIDNLTSGTYRVTVTDANGCSSESPDVQIQAGACALQVTNSFTPIFCAGDASGSIQLNVTGASGDISVQWSNGSPDTTLIVGLSSGTYQYTVTDGAGCDITDEVTISEPDPIAISLSLTDIACGGDSSGTAAVTVSGAQGVYAVSWSNGDLGESVDHLGAGSYSISIMDELGCTFTDSFSITENAPLLIQIDTVTSADGSIQVTVSGGVEPYSYEWSNDTSAVSTDEDLSGAAPGLYQLLVTDGLGCSTSTDTIHIEETSARFEETLIQQIRMYPNPVRTELNLSVPGELIGSQLILYNALGQHVWKGKISFESTTILRQNWSRGWYSLQIRLDDRQISFPVLIQD